MSALRALRACLPDCVTFLADLPMNTPAPQQNAFVSIPALPTKRLLHFLLRWWCTAVILISSHPAAHGIDSHKKKSMLLRMLLLLPNFCVSSCGIKISHMIQLQSSTRYVHSCCRLVSCLQQLYGGVTLLASRATASISGVFLCLDVRSILTSHVMHSAA